MIFSIHVPKTAGTSFRLGLVESGAKVRFLYHNRFGEPCLIGKGYGIDDLESKHCKRSMREQVDEARDSGCEILHGHYKHYHITPIIGDRMICWVRDPVERAVSEWAHFAAKRNETEVLITNKFLAAIADKQTDYIGNHLAFAFIGVVETYARDLDIFNELFGTDVPNLKYNVRKFPIKWDKALVDRVASYNVKDQNLYATIQARSRRYL